MLNQLNCEADFILSVYFTYLSLKHPSLKESITCEEEKRRVEVFQPKEIRMGHSNNQ